MWQWDVIALRRIDRIEAPDKADALKLAKLLYPNDELLVESVANTEAGGKSEERRRMEEESDDGA